MQLKRAHVPAKDLVCFYIAYIQSVLLYACQVFHDSLPEYLSSASQEYKGAPSILYMIHFPFSLGNNCSWQNYISTYQYCQMLKHFNSPDPGSQNRLNFEQFQQMLLLAFPFFKLIMKAIIVLNGHWLQKQIIICDIDNCFRSNTCFPKMIDEGNYLNWKILCLFLETHRQ